MGRFRASEGALSLGIAIGPRAALLCFDISDKSLLEDLHGFLIRREQVPGESGDAPAFSKPLWIGDPREQVKCSQGDISKNKMTSSAYPDQIASPSRPADGGCSDSKGAEDDLLGSEKKAHEIDWRRALRRAIRSFKWGDYLLEPGAEYKYTLYLVYGDPQQGISCGSDDQLPKTGPGLHLGPISVSLKVTVPQLYGDTHEVHFNRGVTGQRFSHLFPDAREQGKRGPEQWQWLSRGLEEALLHFISNAKGAGWKLYGALYEAHYLPIMRALEQARVRGVEVKLIVDWKVAAWSDEKKTWSQRGPQHLNFWALHESGLLSADCVIERTKPLSSISHNKFFILISPTEEPVAVWTGSTNITSGAIFGHSNVGHVVREPEICDKYLKYWHYLKGDPEKRDVAKFNEELTPLPEGEGPDALKDQDVRVLFSPRLRWAHALDFFAQLVLSAKSSVAFTAAFGISKELAPALLGGAKSIPKYILLEGEGSWAASKEAVSELKRQPNVRVAVGTHFENPAADPDSRRGGWLPEKVTGLNQHVLYVHTKILIVDALSESPIVVSGSANFSRASMESNDENMIVVRGSKNLADAYIVEFFRIFEHMHFRNRLEQKKKLASQTPEKICCCGETVVQRVCQKGPNSGRPFAACPKPRDKVCGYFKWLDENKEPYHQSEDASPWPQKCFDSISFDSLERQMCNSLMQSTVMAASPFSTKVSSNEVETTEATEAFENVEEALEAMGVLEGEDQQEEETLHALPGALASSSQEAVPHGLLECVQKAVHDLLGVESNKKGGSVVWRAKAAELVTQVRSLPEQACAVQATLLDLLDEMDRNFIAKTKSSWKVYLLRALRVLGEDECRVTEVSRRHRMGQKEFAAMGIVHP
eukprot:gnl/MRDRNA2_/MRDRNA2_27952_c0_seq1.p1 gnl/MRDRNA2_/MRDRNA2_27952_c0~~gnl/MRDRNA2_/MRDRNA2_27952_c0_seq1.p1  ORF type:complete len:875 (-),score=154.36 gnl/MRDRNA2_/MRDRNA2_27952_c0_seq1:82-2706(-)